MTEAVIVLDPAFVVGRTDPRLFGSFVEHLGRCVYGGIFEPDTRQLTMTDSGRMCWNWFANSGSP